MEKYFFEINFSYLCTPIDVVYFLINFKGDERECKLSTPSVASHSVLYTTDWYNSHFYQGTQ